MVRSFYLCHGLFVYLIPPAVQFSVPDKYNSQQCLIAGLPATSSSLRMSLRSHIQLIGSIRLCRMGEVIQPDGSMDLPGLGVVLRKSGFSRLQ